MARARQRASFSPARVSLPAPRAQASVRVVVPGGAVRGAECTLYGEIWCCNVNGGALKCAKKIADALPDS